MAYKYRLRFYIQGDLSYRIKSIWNDIKEDCENGENRWIADLIVEHCQLESNKKLCYYETTEGGLCYWGKSLRFRFNDYNYNDNNIVMLGSFEEWTYAELNDICMAFKEVIMLKTSEGDLDIGADIVMDKN